MLVINFLVLWAVQIRYFSYLCQKNTGYRFWRSINLQINFWFGTLTYTQKKSFRSYIFQSSRLDARFQVDFGFLWALQIFYRAFYWYALVGLTLGQYPSFDYCNIWLNQTYLPARFAFRFWIVGFFLFVFCVCIFIIFKLKTNKCVKSEKKWCNELTL